MQASPTTCTVIEPALPLADFPRLPQTLGTPVGAPILRQFTREAASCLLPDLNGEYHRFGIGTIGVPRTSPPRQMPRLARSHVESGGPTEPRIHPLCSQRSAFNTNYGRYFFFARSGA
jgi:hypothetical protein